MTPLARLRDGALLAAGTLCVIAVQPPRRLGRPEAAIAMCLAPVVGASLGVVAAPGL